MFQKGGFVEGAGTADMQPFRVILVQANNEAKLDGKRRRHLSYNHPEILPAAQSR